MITLQYKAIKNRYTIAILVDGILRHQYFFDAVQDVFTKRDAIDRVIDMQRILHTERPRFNRSLSMYPVPGSNVVYRTYLQIGIYKRIFWF